MSRANLFFLSLFGIAFGKYLILSNSYLDLAVMVVCGVFALAEQVDLFNKQQKSLTSSLILLQEEIHILRTASEKERSEMKEIIKTYKEQNDLLNTKITEVRTAMSMQKVNRPNPFGFGQPG